MSGFPPARGPSNESDLSVDQVLQFLDLATEVLEGMDELGVSTRAELLAVMDRLERLVGDET